MGSGSNVEDVAVVVVVNTGAESSPNANLSEGEAFESELVSGFLCASSVDILLEIERRSNDDGAPPILPARPRSSTLLTAGSFIDSRDQFSGSFGRFANGTCKKTDPNCFA